MKKRTVMFADNNSIEKKEQIEMNMEVDGIEMITSSYQDKTDYQDAMNFQVIERYIDAEWDQEFCVNDDRFLVSIESRMKTSDINDESDRNQHSKDHENGDWIECNRNECNRYHDVNMILNIEKRNENEIEITNKNVHSDDGEYYLDDTTIDSPYSMDYSMDSTINSPDSFMDCSMDSEYSNSNALNEDIREHSFIREHSSMREHSSEFWNDRNNNYIEHFTNQNILFLTPRRTFLQSILQTLYMIYHN